MLRRPIRRNGPATTWKIWWRRPPRIFQIGYCMGVTSRTELQLVVNPNCWSHTIESEVNMDNSLPCTSNANCVPPELPGLKPFLLPLRSNMNVNAYRRQGSVSDPHKSLWHVFPKRC